MDGFSSLSLSRFSQTLSMIYVKLYQLLSSHKPSAETLILNYGERSLALSSWRWEQQHFYTFVYFQSVLSNVSLISNSQSKQANKNQSNILIDHFFVKVGQQSSRRIFFQLEQASRATRDRHQLAAKKIQSRNTHLRNCLRSH